MKPESPFDGWAQPTAQRCAEVVERLAALHGRPSRPKDFAADMDIETAECGGVPTILDALVRTILSQHTTSRNSRRAMDGLVARFGGDYEAVLKASLAEVVQSIACGGLANLKGARIKQLVADVHAEYGDVTLEHLRPLPDTDIKQALMRYRGVGAKTASCVLLFCLGRDSFAVDTHVFRLAKKLGWIPQDATHHKAHLHLDARVPKALHYPLHVLLVRHGKSCDTCAPRGRPQMPSEGPCPL